MRTINDTELTTILNDGNVSIDYSFSNFLNEAKMKPDMKMMFGQYFHEGEICILAGKTGTGKSTLAYTIADGISKGNSILEQANECEPQKVLFYDFELTERNIKKRFFQYEPNENFLRPDMTKILLQHDGQFNFDIIEDDILQTGAKVIVIDNISAIVLRSLQDADTSLQLMKDATNLKNKMDVSILLIAHTPKLRETRPLELYDIAGSSHLHNFIDSAVMVGKSSQDVNLRYIKQVKSRNAGEMDNVMTVEINPENWLHFDYVGMSPESEHLQYDDLKAEQKRNELIEIAESIIGNREISYNDFCSKYAEQFGKSQETGKKIHKQLKQMNLIIKNSDDRKWIINRNEIPF